MFYPFQQREKPSCKAAVARRIFDACDLVLLALAFGETLHIGHAIMNITSLTLWHLPLTSHIAYNMSDGKICDTVTTNILRLESDDGLTGCAFLVSPRSRYQLVVTSTEGEDMYVIAYSLKARY